jgi:hypothetical protein
MLLQVSKDKGSRATADSAAVQIAKAWWLNRARMMCLRVLTTQARHAKATPEFGARIEQRQNVSMPEPGGNLDSRRKPSGVSVWAKA